MASVFRGPDQTPPRSPPARPLTVSCAARHGMKEENQRQKRVARSACSCPCRAEPTLGLLLPTRKSAEHGLGSTKDAQTKRDAAKPRPSLKFRPDNPTLFDPSPGICQRWGGRGQRDRWRHGWRHRAPMEGFTACPAGPSRPAQLAAIQSLDRCCCCCCLPQAAPAAAAASKPLRSSSPAPRPGRCSCPGSSRADAASHPPAAPAPARTHASTRP